MVHKAMAKLGQVTAAASDLRREVWEEGVRTIQRVRDSDAIAAEGGQVRRRNSAETAHSDAGEGQQVDDAVGGNGAEPSGGERPSRGRLRKKTKVTELNGGGRDRDERRVSDR